MGCYSRWLACPALEGVIRWALCGPTVEPPPVQGLTPALDRPALGVVTVGVVVGGVAGAAPRAAVGVVVVVRGPLLSPTQQRGRDL